MSFPINRNRPTTLGFVGLLLVLGVALLIWYIFENWGATTIDAPLKQALSEASKVSSYSQYIDTVVQFPARSLRIIGTYDTDTRNERYSSYSTTTLYIGTDRTGHTFTHKNIAIGKDVYVKIETNDKMLKSSIQQSHTWRHFTGDAIPTSFESIAIDGPIEDNLQLLGGNGKYLALTRKHGLESLNGEMLLHYSFKLSGKSEGTPAGPLTALMDRLGSNGLVDLWIGKDTAMPRVLRFKTDTYTSTTTLSSINMPLSIVPPIAQ